MGVARRHAVRVKRSQRTPPSRGFLSGCDACCVIGGDGTLLGAAREAARAGVPIIGVNCGSLGFLTTFSADEARAHFAELLRGRYRVDRRAMLECVVGAGKRDLALNDVIVTAGEKSRLVRLEVFADDELVTDYFSDGVIFSTPTGSTAYNLSAGGPILHPSARVVAMTPICPHTLSNRSIIFRQSVKLRVRNGTEGAPLLVAVDGQRRYLAAPGAPVRISVARTRVSLAQRPDYAHFAVVRAKLKWSGGFAEKK
jgi:NAD+ kinase